MGNFIYKKLIKRFAGKDPVNQKGRAWAEIDRSSLRHNLAELKRLLPQGCRIMAVVKADAYGHGAVPVASSLQGSGVRAFAVASLEEGIQLRQNGIRGTILVLGYTHPSNTGLLIKYRLTQTVVDYAHAIALNGAASLACLTGTLREEKTIRIGRAVKTGQTGRKLKVHIKIDTGMHRLGEDSGHLEEIAAIFRLPNLKIDGMYTHLCAADSVREEDVRFTQDQFECFNRVTEYIGKLGYPLPALHLQGSYGVLNYPELNCSFARIGIALYGSLSREDDKTNVFADLKPAMSIKARIALVRDLPEGLTVGYGRQFTADRPMRIAAVSIGYADGVPRGIAGGSVLINGKAAPMIGRVCMDQLTVDVTGIPDVKAGDIATIVGQDGEESILPEQLAGNAGTIANELLSRLGSRLQRIYV